MLRELHPEIEDRDHPVPLELACEYVAAHTALRAAKKRAQLATNLLADEMGLARRAVVGEGKDARSIATRQSCQGGRPSVIPAQRFPDLPSPVPALEPTDDLTHDLLAAFRDLPPIPNGALAP